MKSLLTRKNIFWIKLLLSVALVVYIAAQANWAEVAATFRQAVPSLLFAVLVLVIVNFYLSVAKWWTLLRIHDKREAFGLLSRWYGIALFFNNFLPTGIGGDAYRIYRMIGAGHGKFPAFIVILIERVSGLLALLVIGWLAAALHHRSSPAPVTDWLYYAGLAGIGAAAVVLPLFVFAWRSAPVQGNRWIRRISLPLDAVVRVYREQPLQALLIMSYSLLFQALAITWLWLLATALGGELSWSECAVLTTMITVIALIPVSINGYGLVDGSFIVMATQMGLDGATALGVMLGFRIVSLLFGFAGMLVYLLDRGNNAVAIPTEKPTNPLYDTGESGNDQIAK